MAAWRIVVKNLYAIGGFGTSSQIDGGFSSDVHRCLQELKRYGLVEGERIATTGYRRPKLWKLTQKGTDFCEGRLRTAGRRGGMKFVPTWTAPLGGSTVLGAIATVSRTGQKSCYSISGTEFFLGAMEDVQTSLSESPAATVSKVDSAIAAPEVQ